MILSFILLIITTWVIHSWGNLLNNFIDKSKQSKLSFFETYFLGFCVLAFAANSISLFFPLNGWTTLPFLLLVPIILTIADVKSPAQAFNAVLPKTQPVKFFTLICLLALITMHPWLINHPDTLTYQNDLIKYALLGSHPSGIVEIKNQYGYGGAYFPIAALFSFYVFLGKTMTFINLSLASTFILFLCHRLDRSYFIKDGFNTIWLLILIGLGFYEYTFFRLAVTSSAPDTPAAMVGLFAFFYFFRNDRKGWILALLTLTGVTLKLSLAPILLLPLWHLIKNRNKSETLACCLIALFIGIPFLSKNIVSTGYLIYPMASTKVMDRKYTPHPQAVKLEANYIKAYARNTNASRSEKVIEKITRMPMREWIPTWWSQIQWAGRLLVVIFFISLIAIIWRMVRIQILEPDELAFIITICFGFMFWINLAPAIRFGSAFLLAPLIYLTESMPNPIKDIKRSKASITLFLKGIIALLTLALSAYVIYRLVYYMDGDSIWIPKGPAI